MVRCAWILFATAGLLLTAEVGHSGPEFRDISEYEAHDLLAEYLKLSGGAVYRLAADFGYKEYYFFQAEQTVKRSASKDESSGSLWVRYYAVDRKTADVWDAGFCQQIASRPLTRLQQVLRNHIGLTDTEYRRLRRPGPFCEPGYPRLPPTGSVSGGDLGAIG
jgi:hypothetical protein